MRLGFLTAVCVNVILFLDITCWYLLIRPRGVIFQGPKTLRITPNQHNTEEGQIKCVPITLINVAQKTRQIHTAKTEYIRVPRTQYSRTQTATSGTAKKLFSGPAARTDWLKIFTLSRKDQLLITVTWSWSERVHLCSRQRYYRERQKHVQHSRAYSPFRRE